LVLLLALAAPRAVAASPASYDDLLAELSARIAAAVAPSDRVHLIITADSGTPAGARTDIAQRLAARGIQTADAAAGVPVVRVACSANLRERVCAADVLKAGGSQTVLATAAIAADAADPGSSAAMLDVRHVFSQHAAILDVALLGDRLIVLDSTGITLYQRAANAWQKRRSQPIASSRVWPRDVRGRLRIAGPAVEAYLPGVVCRATIDSFTVSCADERQPWPLAIENTGVAAGRNYFTTPEGLTFYAAAALESDAGGRWLLVGDRARLMLLDDGRRTVEDAIGEGGDVAGVTGCGAGSFALVSSQTPANDGHDVVRLVRVADRRLIAAAPSVVLPGAVTALWPASAPATGTATAIVHDSAADRYDAIQIEVACGR